MLNKKVEKAINDQIVQELYSAYLYLAMSAYFETLNLKGAAHWMRCQAQEEMIHAMKFYTHIVDRGGQVQLGAIEKPPATWASPRLVFEAAYAHEQKVSALINNIVNIVLEEKEHASQTLLQWFTNEQIEEEASTNEVAQKLRLAGDSGPGVFMVDQELAQRVFTYPTTINGTPPSAA